MDSEIKDFLDEISAHFFRKNFAELNPAEFQSLYGKLKSCESVKKGALLV